MFENPETQIFEIFHISEISENISKTCSYVQYWRKNCVTLHTDVKKITCNTHVTNLAIFRKTRKMTKCHVKLYDMKQECFCDLINSFWIYWLRLWILLWLCLMIHLIYFPDFRIYIIFLIFLTCINNVYRFSSHVYILETCKCWDSVFLRCLT